MATKNNIEIYINPACFFCTRAIHLLQEKKQSIKTIDVVADPKKKEEMIERSNGGFTTPQIFINNKHIGGCDDLYALEDKGKLNPLLGL